MSLLHKTGPVFNTNGYNNPSLLLLVSLTYLWSMSSRKLFTFPTLIRSSCNLNNKYSYNCFIVVLVHNIRVIIVQWNLSIADTIGKYQSGLVSEVVLYTKVTLKYPDNHRGDLSVYPDNHRGDLSVYTDNQRGDLSVYPNNHRGDLSVYPNNHRGDLLVYPDNHRGDLSVSSIEWFRCIYIHVYLCITIPGNYINN